MSKLGEFSLTDESSRPGEFLPAGCGLPLKFLPPDTKDTVVFNDEEWKEGISMWSMWQFSLVGQVLGLNVRFKAMEIYVKKIWANLATPDIFILKLGIFLFKFKNKDEMSEILENGPWFFGSRPLSLKPWSIGDDYEKINDGIYLVWILLPALKLNLWNAKMLLVVQLPLKLNLWNAKSISKIASAVGRPITTDKLTANKQRLAYARVLVETTATPDLPNNSMHMLNISQRSDGKDKASVVSLFVQVSQQIGMVAQSGIILMMYKESKYAEYHNFQGCTVWCMVYMHNILIVCRIPQFSGLHSLVHGVHAQHTDPEALLETKIKDILLPGITRKIAKTWNWMSNVRSLIKARILILWNPNMLDIQLISCTDQSITCIVKSFDGKLDCAISSIYGFNHLYARKVLWYDLKSIHQTIGSTPWLLCGDFNAITSNEEKIGGIMLTDSDTEDFRAFINDCQLAHLKTIGQVEFLVPKISDHSLGLITVSEEYSQGKRPLEFFRMWTKHDCFLPTVANAWQQRIKGCVMFSVCSKLKNLKIALKDINRKFFYNIRKEMHFKIQHLEGLHHNRVMLLYNNLGQRLTEGDDIVNEFITHFKSLMGTAVDTTPPNINIIHSGPCLDDSQANNKAPGPDGFNVAFFKSSWSVVGDEVTQAVDEFFKTGKLLGLEQLWAIVNDAHSAFVKGTQITNNILFAHELINNYNRKSVSPRVMLSIDIKKAFDTISWSFLKDMLKGLGFPNKMVDWMMTCIFSARLWNFASALKNIWYIHMNKELLCSIMELCFSFKEHMVYSYEQGASLDKVDTWQILEEQRYMACPENRDHLFFDYDYSQNIWNRIMSWLKFRWRSCNWSYLLNWFNNCLRGKRFKKGIKRMTFSATLYKIWYERNARIFLQKSKGIEQLVNEIKVDILVLVLNGSIQPENREWINFL
ncbi:uncharacterized protein LOC109830936 [Asparagus officinalis]|uniref:uncharacterized protein LOC109830936 n=1 Tax=Asparagus officinalis TaxID=4686 RepID=UPI00098E2098|nr:uncharacterized protein LOC109830936 [Asparagus officinalis]